MSADKHSSSASAGSFEDANLRALASAIDLPGAAIPDRDQLSRWKGGDARDDGPIPIASAPPRRLRARILAAGSAIAATVAIAGVLFTQGRASRVEAATILASLRQAVIGGVNVSLRGFAAEGFALDGDIQVRFARPLNIEALMNDDNGDFPEIAALHGALDMVASEGSPIPGLNLHVELASTQPSTWAIVRANNPSVIAKDANARRIMGFAMHGVMLDLGEGGLKALESLGDHLHNADGERGTVTIGLNTKEGVHVKVDHDDREQGVHAQIVAKPDDAANAQMEADIQQHDQLLRAILTGRAGEAELQDMLALLQRHAADATVEPQGNGRYLLKVLIDPDHDAGIAGPPAGSMVQVSYAQDQGVEWAEFMTTGEVTGAVRVEFSGDPIEPQLLDKNRVIVPGKTMVVTPSTIKALMGID